MLILGIFTTLFAVALSNFKATPVLYIRIVSIILFFSALLTLNTINLQAIEEARSLYNGLFFVTLISQKIELFIYIIGAFIIFPWKSITSRHETSIKITDYPQMKEHGLIVLFTTAGASFLVTSGDLVSIYLSIELQSFGLYIIAAFYRQSESATSAGLKYFLLGGLSSCFILLGTAVIYSVLGTTQLENIYTLLSVINDDPYKIRTLLGIIILFVGFLFKISAAPFHNWAPDVYDGVPTIITTWLTIIPKISIFILILELTNGFSYLCELEWIDNTCFDVLKWLILSSALLSMLVGTIVGLVQTRIKRLLAYSTISHVGFMLLAVGINSQESMNSFIFYLITYTLTNLNAFLVLLAFGYIINNTASIKRITSDIQFIHELTGQFRYHPLLGLALTLSLFSIAGIPPLIGFFGKQIVLSSAIENGYNFITIIAIIVSVISASYYLKIIRVIHFENKEDESRNEIFINKGKNQLTNIHTFVIATLTFIIVLYMLNPSILLNSTNLIALSLFQN